MGKVSPRGCQRDPFGWLWQFGDTPSCLKSGLNTIRCEISRSLRNLHCLPRLLCHADAFHLRSSLFSNFFWTFPSLISPQRLVCLPLPVSPLHLERWHRHPTPTHASPPQTMSPPLSLCFTGRWWRMTESASRFSHHTEPLVSGSFWFLPDVPHDLHLLHSQPRRLALCSRFSIPPLFFLHGALLVQTISPHFGNSCLEAHHRVHSLPSSWCLFTLIRKRPKVFTRSYLVARNDGCLMSDCLSYWSCSWNSQTIFSLWLLPSHQLVFWCACALVCSCFHLIWPP